MKINDKTSSFSLIRTNPKISGNVKITTDSKGDIWLNSFDANRELADVRFKRFKVSPNSRYGQDLKRFFDNGKTPTDIVFGPKEIDAESVTSIYSEQFDFFYAMGVEPLISKSYDENYSYLAPLWLRDDIPQYFVVFRVDDPMDFPYNKGVTFLENGVPYKLIGSSDFSIKIANTIYRNGEDIVGGDISTFTVIAGNGKVVDMRETKNYPFDITAQFDELLKKSTVIKTFDLSENSSIGKYIRNIKYDRDFPESSLTVRFEEDVLTTWNGISYTKGVYVANGEFLTDFWKGASSQIGFEEYITDGFTRHGIIDPHLLNLEFLFDDDSAEMFTIPRYMGFYVNKVDIGTLQLDGSALYQNRHTSGNLPVPKRPNQGFRNQEEKFVQNNPGGVRIFYTTEGVDDITNNYIPTSEDVSTGTRSFYIQDKDGNFYSLSTTEDYNINTKDLVLKNKVLDLDKFTGPVNTKAQVKGRLTSRNGRGYATMSLLNELAPNDVIYLNWPLGENTWTNSMHVPSQEANINDYHINTVTGEIYKYDGISWQLTGDIYDLSVGFYPSKTTEVKANQVPGQNPGDNYESLYFYPNGPKELVATAISNAFNHIEYKQFDVARVDSDLIFRVKETGTGGNDMFIMGSFSNRTRGNVRIQGDLVNNMSPRVFVGGTDRSNVRVIFEKDALGSVIGDSWIKTNRGYSKVSHVGRYVDDMKFDAFGRPMSIEGYNDLAVLHISSPTDIISISQGLFNIYDLYDVPIGLFSFFNIKEMDGDFWDSDYGRSPIEEYHRYFDILPNEDVLVPDRKYVVKGSGSILYFDGTNNVVFETGQVFTVQPHGDRMFSVLSGDPLVVPELFTDYNKDTEEDLKSFPGFSTLKSMSLFSGVDTTSVLFQNRDKFFDGSISSEYDYLMENFNVDYAIKSRLFPSITKWVYKGSTDIRDNPYRLNTLPVFGQLNFSPSFDVKRQDPSSFTHEWYYLESSPQQYAEKFKKDNYYFFGVNINESSLRDANPNGQDEFTRYFTFNPDPTSGRIPDQERYVIFKYNKETDSCEAFFRGIKININEILRGAGTVDRPVGVKNSRKYDGYKFTSLLRVKRYSEITQGISVIESPVTIEFIENKTHRNITLLVTVILDDYRTSSFFDMESPTAFIDSILLYSLKSRKEINENYSQGEPELGHPWEISDTKLSVGLNLARPTGTVNIPGAIGIAVHDNINYDWDLRDEVKNFGLVNSFYGDYAYGNFIAPSPTSVTQDRIIVIPEESTVKFMATPSVDADLAFITVPSTAGIWNKPSFQKAGGKGYMEPILERVSFARMAQNVNERSKYIKYTTHEWINGKTVIKTGEFFMDFVKPTMIVKNEAIIPEIDDDKPEELTSESVIGVIHNKIGAKIEMLRYSGPYEPKFRSLLYFKDQSNDSISDIDLSYKQTTFAPSVDGFGIVKNNNFVKVSDKDILLLKNNQKFRPLYHMVGEVAIDKRDMYMFHSSWDPGFWTKHVNNIDFVRVAGTREMKETKNYMAAKIMKTPKNIRIQNMSIEQVPSIDTFNVDNMQSEMIYEISDTRIRVIANVGKRLIRWFMESGADKEFIKNILPQFGVLDPNNLEEDVLEYLKMNIIPQYIVESIDIYTITSKGDLAFPTVVGNLTDSQKLVSGFRVNKNVVTQNRPNLYYYFEYNRDSKINISFAPSVNIRKI
jgi:hypothetical protein